MVWSKKYFGVVGAVFIAVGLWSFPVYGQPGPRGPGPGFPGPGMPGPGGMIDGPATMLPFLLRGVNLTAEQHARIQQIMANQHGAFRELFDQMGAVQEKLADKLFTPGRLQESDLSQLTQQLSQLRNQLAQEGLRVMLEVRGVLTPEQLAKAAELRQQMQALQTQMRNLFERAR